MHQESFNRAQVCWAMSAWLRGRRYQLRMLRLLQSGSPSWLSVTKLIGYQKTIHFTASGGDMGLYSIHVLEYAYTVEFPKGSLIYGNYNSGTEKMPYGYVLIKGKGVCALVDVGFNNVEHGAELARNFSIVNWRSAEQVLAECDVHPDDVTHVFITHAHFDHMGGTDLFRNAKFYIQEVELSKWVWMLSLEKRFRWLLSAIDPSDIVRVVDLAKQGRLVSVRGAMEDVLPSIDLVPAYDSHTPGSQYVIVRNDGKRNSEDVWALVGDLVYKYENLHGFDRENPEYR